MGDNILKELYNKVLSLFKQTEKEENAKDVARNRLRVVLMQDRTNLTPELLQRMRKELVELLSKYVEMDKEALELNLDQDGDQMALMLSIPVIRAKDEEEIKAELEKEDKAKAEKEESLEETDTDETQEKNDETSEEENETEEKTEDLESLDETEAEDVVEDASDENSTESSEESSEDKTSKKETKDKE